MKRTGPQYHERNPGKGTGLKTRHYREIKRTGLNDQPLFVACGFGNLDP